MTSTYLLKRTAAVALSLGALLAPALLASPAAAQYGYRIQPQEWRFETKRPERGYEGFPVPGVYCSYRREPNRVCTYDKNGREKCRIESWTLVQICS